MLMYYVVALCVKMRYVILCIKRLLIEKADEGGSKTCYLL